MVLVGIPPGSSGSQVRMMVEDIGIPVRVESQKNGEWVLVWEFTEENNRSLRLNGQAWNLGDGPVQCTVRGRDFGLEACKRAILKEIERQDSRGGSGQRASTWLLRCICRRSMSGR